MVSIKESEQLGNALNILEVLNDFLISKVGKLSIYRKHFIHLKIVKVIEFMDSVIC